jgi:hypothetical protein
MLLRGGGVVWNAFLVMLDARGREEMLILLL